MKKRKKYIVKSYRKYNIHIQNNETITQYDYNFFLPADSNALPTAYCPIITLPI